jgi:hypothetical protein
MSTPANALFGPVKVDAEGNTYVSPDGGLTWTPNAIPAASPSGAGLMTAAQAASLAAVPAGAGVESVIVSGEIDLVAGSTGVTFSCGAVPGYYFIYNRFQVIVDSVAGTLVTPPTTKWGNNGTHDNLQAAANFFTSALFALTPPAWGIGSTSATPNTLVDLAAPILLDVVTPAAGSGTAFTGRVLLFGYFLKHS